MPSAEAANSTTKATRGRVGAGHARTCWAGSQGAGPATARRQRRGGRVRSPGLRENTGEHEGRGPEPPGSKASETPTQSHGPPPGATRLSGSL